MRFLGWIPLITGIFGGLGLALAEVGEVQFPAVAFSVAALLIIHLWRLRKGLPQGN
jgi:hypothetical protein